MNEIGMSCSDIYNANKPYNLEDNDLSHGHSKWMGASENSPIDMINMSYVEL